MTYCAVCYLIPIPFHRIANKTREHQSEQIGMIIVSRRITNRGTRVTCRFVKDLLRCFDEKHNVLTIKSDTLLHLLVELIHGAIIILEHTLSYCKPTAQWAFTLFRSCRRLVAFANQSGVCTNRFVKKKLSVRRVCYVDVLIGERVSHPVPNTSNKKQLKAK